MSLERKILPDGTSVFVEVPRKPAFALAYKKAFGFKKASIAEGIGDSALEDSQTAFEEWATNKFQLKGDFNGGNNFNNGEYVFPTRNADKDLVNQIGEARTPWKSIRDGKPKKKKKENKGKRANSDDIWKAKRRHEKGQTRLKSQQSGLTLENGQADSTNGTASGTEKGGASNHKGRLDKLKIEQMKVVEKMVRMAQRAEEARAAQFEATKDPDERRRISRKMEQERVHSRNMLSDMLSMAMGPEGTVVVTRHNSRGANSPSADVAKTGAGVRLPKIRAKSASHVPSGSGGGAGVGGTRSIKRRGGSSGFGRPAAAASGSHRKTRFGSSSSREGSAAHVNFMNAHERQGTARRSRAHEMSSLATHRQRAASSSLATPRTPTGFASSALTSTNLRRHKAALSSGRGTAPVSTQRRPKVSAMSTGRVMAMKNQLMQKYASIVRQEHQLREELKALPTSRTEYSRMSDMSSYRPGTARSEITTYSFGPAPSTKHRRPKFVPKLKGFT
eukprot:INCI14554.1.p1 GENE.INCI14554.1~~INCI14554.1.p1  ORF type:complete len:504 (+),score=77.54 INCI14554.1:107-1618(+)